MATKLDARQIRSRDVLQQIYPHLAEQELDDLLRSIDFDLTPPLQLDATATPSLVVNVGADTVDNTLSDRQQSLSHISGVIPSYAGGTITFPSSSGTITLAPGNNNSLTIGSNEFVKVLVYLDASSNLNVLPGAANAVEANAIVPPPPADTIPRGYIVVSSDGGGNVNAINQDKIFQFAAGSSSSTAGSTTALDRLEAMWDAIVGSVGQVGAGVATHSSIQSVNDDGGIASGSRVFVLKGTHAGATLSKSLVIEGQGITTVIQGVLTVNSNFCDISKVLLDGNADFVGYGNHVRGWQSDAPDVNDYTEAVGNDVNIIQYT